MREPNKIISLLKEKYNVEIEEYYPLKKDKAIPPLKGARGMYNNKAPKKNRSYEEETNENAKHNTINTTTPIPPLKGARGMYNNKTPKKIAPFKEELNA